MSYLQQYDAIPVDRPADKVALVSRWIRTDWRPFFAELRERRPILVTPAFTLVTHYRDVIDVLSRPEAFSVRLYAPKMDPVVGGPFMLARDQTAVNWREKGVMQSVLSPEDLVRVRELAGRIADESLDRHACDGRIEVVNKLGRLVPLRICWEYFGFAGPDLDTLFRWSKATQTDMFKNLANDQAVHQESVRAGTEMTAYLKTQLARRRADLVSKPSATPTGDVFDRLVRTRFAPDVPFDDGRIIANMAGLLIGAGETTSQAVVQVVQQILSRPDVHEQAVAAAKSHDDKRFDAIVWEALRFNPVNPLLFRFCERPTPVAGGSPHATEIPARTVVFACTASAMFDAAVFPAPDTFNPDRPRDPYLHFGYGHHYCLGGMVGGVMVSEVVKRVVMRPGVRLLTGDEGKIDFQNGPFPERFIIGFGS